MVTTIQPSKVKQFNDNYWPHQKTIIIVLYRIENNTKGTVNSYWSPVLNYTYYHICKVVHTKVNFSQASFHLSVISGLWFPVFAEFNNVSPFSLLWRKFTLICIVNKASPLVKYTVYRATSKSAMYFNFFEGRHQNIP